jgi:hypothetical protein
MGKKTSHARKHLKSKEKLRKNFARGLPSDVKKLWSAKKTFLENVNHLGILYKVNKDVKGINKEKKEKPKENKIDDPDDVFDDSMEAKEEEDTQGDFLSIAQLPSADTHKKTIKKLKEDEVEILQSLKSKYGKDYSKMKWDIKLNRFQWNKHQIIRKLALLSE